MGWDGMASLNVRCTSKDSGKTHADRADRADRPLLQCEPQLSCSAGPETCRTRCRRARACPCGMGRYSCLRCRLADCPKLRKEVRHQQTQPCTCHCRTARRVEHRQNGLCACHGRQMRHEEHRHLDNQLSSCTPRGAPAKRGLRMLARRAS